jgi:hypothetical protein
MGQIRKLGTIWWVRYYRNGKRYGESSGKTSYYEAKKLLADREGDIAKGIPVSPQRLTFENAMQSRDEGATVALQATHRDAGRGQRADRVL